MALMAAVLHTFKHCSWKNILLTMSLLLNGGAWIGAHCQGTAEVHYYVVWRNRFDASQPGSPERYDARFDGKTISIDCESNNCAGTTKADVSDVDVETIEITEETSTIVPTFYQVNFTCKVNKQCATYSGSSGTTTYDHFGFRCASRQECSIFVEAVRRAAASLNRPAEQLQPTTSPRTHRPEVMHIPTAAPTSVQRQPPAANDLHDLLASIGWLSSSNGTNNAMDQLLRNLRPAQPRPKRPTGLHFTYAAFAQAGGFDANGAWGVGTGTDLNSAIGTAENTCHQGATTCGDEGYCALRPGLWGAWASDLKVAGNSAFSCNLNSEDDARQQAQAWCGDSCKVLWSGAAQ